MELGLILGRNLEKPGKRQNLGVFQGFSRSNFAFLPFSRFFQVFQVFQVTWQPWTSKYLDNKIFQEFLLNTIHNIVHGSAHAATNLMHNVFGKRAATQALSAKEEV